MIYGTYNSPRIVAQRGGFALFGQGSDPIGNRFSSKSFPSKCLTKIVLKKEYVNDIRASLFRKGFSESVVFPTSTASPKKFEESSNFKMSQKFLRITLHPSKPLIWWYTHRNSIDMNPSYQRRGRLWSQSDKAYLIDSIINGFDVPKLYLADFQMGESQLNTSKLPYAIIDGKQRLEAIFDFFDEKLVLNEDFMWRANPSLSLGGLSLRELRANHPKVAEAFETETVDIMSVVTNDEADINELFVRLNRSKPLTGAEIRNAMLGPVPDVIRNVARHSFFTENIRIQRQARW